MTHTQVFECKKKCSCISGFISYNKMMEKTEALGGKPSNCD